MFQVSVIIPVYKAEQFLRRAVESVVLLPEVGEILLVEDGSPDNSLALCRALEKESPKVKVLCHENGQNRGAGATRNLGLKSAHFNYVAFLDADDYYLPNRFTFSKTLFEKDSSIDGIYEPVGVYFYSDEAKRKFMAARQIKPEEIESYVSMLRGDIKPEDVFINMIHGRNKSFHTNGITLRKSILERSGYFNETLRLHQDSELWIRIAFYGKLVSGSKTVPVAVRGVHDDNRIAALNYHSKSLLYKAIFDHFIKGKRKLSRDAYLLISKQYAFYHPRRRFYNKNGVLKYLELAYLFCTVFLIKR